MVKGDVRGRASGRGAAPRVMGAWITGARCVRYVLGAGMACK